MTDGWKDALTPGTKTTHVLRVPAASNDPAALTQRLAFDAYGTLFQLRAVVRELDEQKKLPGLLESTRARLQKLRDANDEHEKILAKLFAPLGVQNIPFGEWSARGEPKGGFLVRGWEHLFKAWAWGEDETRAQLELVKQALEAGPGRFERVLTLGAGACRFPYEVHRWLAPKSSLAIDHNPLELALARRVMQGEELDLWEMPTVPRASDAFAVKSRLRAPEPIGEGFEVLAHDLAEWSLADGRFDLVVTPWFVDAVPIATRVLFARINRALAPGGTWLDVGPLGFNKRVLARYYGREEVMELVERAGFRVDRLTSARLPYFHNPSSGHWRIEEVVAFAATKVREAEVPGDAENEGDRDEGVEWLADTTKPVKPTFALGDLKKHHAFASDLLGRLAQNKSIRELAKAMASKHGLAEAQAEELIRATLAQWQRVGRTNPMRG